MTPGLSLHRLWRLALALPAAVEQDHHGVPSFRVDGKIFATVPDPDHLHVMVGPERIRSLVQTRPDVWQGVRWGGRLACARVDLGATSAEVVGPLLEEAWRRKAPSRLTRASGNGNIRGGAGRSRVPAINAPVDRKRGR